MDILYLEFTADGWKSYQQTLRLLSMDKETAAKHLADWFDNCTAHHVKNGAHCFYWHDVTLAVFVANELLMDVLHNMNHEQFRYIHLNTNALSLSKYFGLSNEFQAHIDADIVFDVSWIEEPVEAHPQGEAVSMNDII